jgi:hypothetical protein
MTICCPPPPAAAARSAPGALLVVLLIVICAPPPIEMELAAWPLATSRCRAAFTESMNATFCSSVRRSHAYGILGEVLSAPLEPTQSM